MTATPARPTNSRKISVVVITHNEGQNLKSTVSDLHNTLPSNSEIVVVDDRSSDGSTAFLKAHVSRNRQPAVHLLRSSRRLGVAVARNVGAARASGDYIVFADAHLTFSPGWQEPLFELLDNPRVGAVSPVICDRDALESKGYGLTLTGPDLEVDWIEYQGEEPHAAPLLPGGCLAMRRDTFVATGGFDQGIIRYGVEDSELSLRLWLLGYECLVVPKVEVAHMFRSGIPYRVYWKTVLHNRLRMALLHLKARRVIRVLKAYQDCHAFAPALALVIESDIAARKADLRSRRVHDDDWFFERFNLNW